jgi:branched-chain amino acid transport system permease protein
MTMQGTAPLTLTAASAVAGARRRRSVPIQPLFTAAVVLGVLVYVQGNSFHEDLFLLSATYSLLALGLYIPFVMTGALSMAYSAYLSIGGYAVARIATETGLPVLLGVVFGAAISAVVAVLVGLVTSRLSSFYLAAVTLLFAGAFEAWVLDTKGITNGASGIGGIRGFSAFGTELTRSQYLAVATVTVWILACGINRMRSGNFGIALRARHEVPIAVEAGGIKVTTLTLISLALGAAIASMGGALFTAYNGSISPETFTLPVVFLAVFMPLLGGRNNAWGAVLGAGIVVYSQFNFTWFEGTGTLMFSLAVLFVLLVAPNGILGLITAGWRTGLRVAGRSRSSSEGGGDDG